MELVVSGLIFLYSVALFLWGVSIGQFMGLRAQTAGKTPDIEAAPRPLPEAYRPVAAPTSPRGQLPTPRVSKNMLRSTASCSHISRTAQL